MNTNLMVDAVGKFDNDLLEKHFKEKEKVKSKKSKPKKAVWLKWSAAVAACLLVVIVAVPTITNLIGYNQGLDEEELFQRTHAFFETYDELATVIGNDTLISNLDTENIVIKEMRLKHELDNVNNFSSLSFIMEIPNGEFGFGVYFPPYDDKLDDYCDGTTSKTINGVLVEYTDRLDKENGQFNYVAEFEYGEYQYVVRSSGTGNDEIFWDTLSDLLGE